MGCFGYICNGCKKSINGGEQAVFKHIRHGQVLGEATGTCDNYGSIEEDKIYRNYDKNNINNHLEICKSEFDLLDSKGYDGKIYKGKPTKWMEFRKLKVAEGMEGLCQEMYDEWDKLEPYKVEEVKSGVEAWHKYCYDRAPEDIKEQHIISEIDPNQSLGAPRKEYMEKEMLRMEKEYLGEFINESGEFIVSDPCYKVGTWCQGKLNNVATGTWKASIVNSDEGDWGIRCAELIAVHESTKDTYALDWELCEFTVGVDSGQAGIFDKKYYNNDDIFDADEKPRNDFGDNKFYGFCCDTTDSEEGAGVLKYGTVSSSRYGDGGYDCFIAKNEKNEIVAVKIIFIGDEDDDYYDDYDDEYDNDEFDD